MTKTAVKDRAPELFVEPVKGELKVGDKVTGHPDGNMRVVSVPKARKGAVVQTLPAPTQPKNMLAIIATAAADSRVDVGKMKELLAMQREIEESEQAREFNRALLAAQEQMPKIVKDRENTHTRSRYATLEKVSKEVDHIARKHGFSMSFGTDDSPLDAHYRIVCDLSHIGGHSRRYKIDLQGDAAGSHGKSNKTPIQGVGSTMSYGRRYLKVMMFDLIIVGEDSDGNKSTRGSTAKERPDADDGVILINRDQLAALIKAVEFCGVGEKKFCDHYQIEKIPDLPQERFDDAMLACKNFAGKKKPVEAKTNG